MPKELALTPIRVRGRRNAGQSPRPRRRRLQRFDHAPMNRMLRLVTDTPQKKRKAHITKLEDLPTEVLELIFLHSGNPDLPLASRSLTAQLAGWGLQNRLMDVTFGAMFDENSTIEPSDVQIALLESMLSRRFCTWEFLHAWLKTHKSKSGAVGRSPQVSPNTGSHAVQSEVGIASTLPLSTAWPPTLCYSAPSDFVLRSFPNPPIVGRLSRPLKVPEKLLHRPWTDAKLEFLDCFCYVNDSHLWDDTDECTRMSSFSGIQDAIEDQSLRALEALLRLGVDPESEFLHMAIIDEGCDEAIVSKLFSWIRLLGTYAKQRLLRWPHVDPLDPVLWTWMGKPAQKTNGKGEFVRTRLKAMAEHERNANSIM